MVIVISLFVFISVFITSSYILRNIFTKKYIERLLSCSSVKQAELPAALALAVIPKSRIFHNISLPIPNRDGEEIQIGTVIVTRSGIFILCQINGSGILENPANARWKRIENGKFTEFDNPFIAQKDARTLIEYYTQINELNDIKAHTLVLYTSDTLRFTAPKSRGVINAKDFVKKLTAFEKRGKLSLSQVKSACNILKSADAYN